MRCELLAPLTLKVADLSEDVVLSYQQIEARASAHKD